MTTFLVFKTGWRAVPSTRPDRVGLPWDDFLPTFQVVGTVMAESDAEAFALARGNWPWLGRSLALQVSKTQEEIERMQPEDQAQYYNWVPYVWEEQAMQQQKPYGRPGRGPRRQYGRARA